MDVPPSGERSVACLVTARARSGDPPGRGVIGLARATSAGDWEVLPSITRPGAYGHMEIPQLVSLGGRWYLLFSVPGPPVTAAGPTADPVAGPVVDNQPPSPAMLTGTHLLSAEGPLGPFEWETHTVLLGDVAGTWYGAKLVEAPDGSLVCLTWLNHDAQGRFVGELSEPMEVDIGPHGPRAVAY